MIGRLSGLVVELQSNLATVDVHGVGYEVLLPQSALHQLPALGMPCTLIIRQIFREDGTMLYGFLEPFQRRMFDLLTEVKGCGPKISLSLIGEVGESAVAAAIVGQDSRTLCQATGVGPRLAERIILELRDKVQKEGHGPTSAITHAAISEPESELVEALLALGYRKQEADLAASQIPADSRDLPTRIRAALQILKK